MSTTLASRYDPKEAQERWYNFWEQKGYFHAEPPRPAQAQGPTSDGPGPQGSTLHAQPFTIVIPPPNVTGALHMGHALNNTLQDILARWRRMQGFNTLWMPGTDHAGIATQAVVEKRLREQEGLTRQQLGRERLVERIWQWKDEYEKRILNQLRRLGSSCDWRRTRFTFDPVCALAVRETFFRMFKDGLIYRGKRLVNWDTHLLTSVADDETYTEEVKGGFWTFKYPVKAVGSRQLGVGEEGTTEYVRFSTTRPETMLGDTAIAVHPDDPRYKHLIGRIAIVPISHDPNKCTASPTTDSLLPTAFASGREIPIIADGLLADPTMGTGAVKVTPAHDPNDYACWQRHRGKPDEIDIINILNSDGTINDAGGKYAGMDRYVARESVTTDMETLGLFEGREDRMIPLKFSDRSKTPIEPYLSDQWFVRMGDEGSGFRVQGSVPEEMTGSRTGSEPEPRTLNPEPSFGLAELAMQAVRDGRVKIHPERYAKTYLDWLGEKRDWCISRQLWWGHRIPVWSFGQNVTGPAERIKTVLGEIIRLSKEYPDQVTVKHMETGGEPSAGPQGQPLRPILLLVCLGHGTDELAHALEACGLVQDPDVLDTWFSSQLWPHSTLGWPERTPASIPPLPVSGERGRGEGSSGPQTGQPLTPTLSPLTGRGGMDATRDAIIEPDWGQMKFYYPTSVLVTSRDIITLWVARMVIAGLYNCSAVPFRDVFVHPKILDGFGQTMSKSKGNGVDPIDIIDKYGADALRFALTYLTTESQDARLPVGYECPFCETYIAQKLEHQQMKPKALKPDAQARDGGALGPDSEDPSLARRATMVKPRIKCPNCKKDFQFSSPNFDPDPGEPVARVVSERFEQGRNFANKLWNAARFVLMNLQDYEDGGFRVQGSGFSQSDPAAVVSPLTTHHGPLTLADEERWILSRLADTIARVTEHLENFRFSEVAKTLYDFAWSDFCDWYVEMAKLRLRDPASRPTAQRVLATVLDHLLRLLHPVTPFVTEHIWQALGEIVPSRGLPTASQAAESVMIAPWPAVPAEWRDPDIETKMGRFQELIRAIRNIRSKFNVDTRGRVNAHVRCSTAVADELRGAAPFIQQLATVENLEAGPDVTKPPESVSAVAPDWELYVPLTGLIDRVAELDRNRKLLASLTAQLQGFQTKLSNANFVAKAPAEVIDQHRQRAAELAAQIASVEEILRELGGP